MVEINYQDIITKELRRRNIRVQKWCKKEPDNGYEAFIDTRIVRVPRPVDSFTFHICLHEIGHIVTGERVFSYLQEYNAEIWSIKQAARYIGEADPEYVQSAKVYVLKHCILDSLIHGVKIRPYVLDWIGVNPAHFKQLTIDNGFKLLMERIKSSIPEHKHWELLEEVHIDKKIKAKLVDSSLARRILTNEILRDLEATYR